MGTASKTHIDCAFMSPSEQVTRNCGWGDSYTPDIFKSCALGHPGNEFLLCHSSDIGFEMALGFLENSWNPAIMCTCNSSIQKKLQKQQTVFNCVLINCYAQNIWNLELSLIV